MHTVLDRPEVLQVLFHPRKNYGSPYSTTDVRLISVGVEPGVRVGGRLYPAESNSPLIIFFHGNGEIAAEYDEIAEFYHQIGVTFLVWDYRGYGLSTGTPTVGNLLKDAAALFERTPDICRTNKLDPKRTYIMGRSLGSASAIEVAVRSSKGLMGIIIESGFSDTFSLLSRLGVRIKSINEDSDGFGNLTKIMKVEIPLLVIHGEADVLIPPHNGRELFEGCGTQQKRLVLIPGGGHNDLMFVGLKTYFDALEAFVYKDEVDRN